MIQNSKSTNFVFISTFNFKVIPPSKLYLITNLYTYSNGEMTKWLIDALADYYCHRQTKSSIEFLANRLSPGLSRGR
jgi:hypothetical protein